jgi:hypothetical protein
MRGDSSTIQSLLVAALLVWVVYRRVRRSFGRQLLQPRRMIIRMVLLVAVGCLLAPLAVRSTAYLTAVIGGLLGGVALGLWGAEHTRFLDADGRRYYVPHTYSGLAVMLLVVGRIAYRMSQIFTGTGAPGHAAQSGVGAHAGAAVVQSPLTVAPLFLLVGYYVCFYLRVLHKSKHPRPSDLEPPAGPTHDPTPANGSEGAA